MMADITPLRPVGTRSLIEVEGIALPASGYIVQTKIAADALPMEFIQYAIGAQLRTIVDHEASARIGFDPDGIHQVRSAMRRLRTHIAQFDDVLDPKWAATSRSELRWFGRRLAGVRDLDVMRDVLSACAASLPPAEVQQLEPLFRSITTQRNAMHDSLRTAFDSRRYQRLIARLTSAVDDPPQRNDIAGTSSDLARVIAATAWDKLNSSVEQLGATPSDAALHHVRRRAKRARFAAEVAVPIVGTPARKLAKSLANVQNVLGLQHDAVVAHQWVKAHARKESTGVNFSAGMVAGLLRNASQSAAREFPAVWQRASRAKLRAWL